MKIAVGSVLLAATLAALFVPTLGPPREEGRDYFAIAQLDYSRVHTYYGGRVLHPLTVRTLALAAGVPVDARAFLWVSIASLSALFVLLAVYHGSWPWIAFLACPLVLDQYRNFYFPELFYAALCAGFLMVSKRNQWAGLPLLFLLYLTRESTIILVGVLVAIALLRRDRRFALSTAAVGAAGMAVNAALVAASLPNRHGIPLALLNAMKIPYNFALNILGLEFWVNTNADTTPAPLWSFPLPFPLGGIREVGYSGFHVDAPVSLLLILVTSFGVLPVVLLSERKRLRPDVPLVYGAAMLALTPLVGTAPSRYILGAWPLFWMLPVNDWRVAALSVAVAWTPAVVRSVSGTQFAHTGSLSELPLTLAVFSVAVVAALYAATWSLLNPVREAVDAQS